MSEPTKLDRKLPPHELNARRNRKRVLTKLPAIAQLPPAHPHQAEPSANDCVHNPASNPIHTP